MKKSTITLLMIIILIIPYAYSQLSAENMDGGGYIIIEADKYYEQLPFFERLFSGALVPPAVEQGKEFIINNEFYGNKGDSRTPFQVQVRISKCTKQTMPTSYGYCPRISSECGVGYTIKTASLSLAQNQITTLKSGGFINTKTTISMPERGCYWLSGLITATDGSNYAVERFPRGFAVVSGQIIGCPDNYCDSVETTSTEGGVIQKTCCYSYIGSSCAKTSTCPESITCNQGYILENGKCVKPGEPEPTPTPTPTPEPTLTGCSEGQVCCKFRDGWWGDYYYGCREQENCILTLGKTYIERDLDIIKLNCGGATIPLKKECYKCENNEKKFVVEVSSTDSCPDSAMAKDLLKCEGNLTLPTIAILSESLTFDEWKDAPAYERVKTICKSTSDCSAFEDLMGTGKEYVVRCSGDSRVQTQFQLDIEELCKNTGALGNYLAVGGGTAGFLTGCYMGAGLGFTAGFSMLGIASIPGSVVGCILGGTAATTMTVSAVKGYSAYSIISCKEKKIAPGMGACIAVPKGEEEKEPFNFCFDWTVRLGKTFSKTASGKDACTYGWIAAIAGALVVLIIFNRLSK